MANPTQKLTVADAKQLRSRLAVSEARPVVLAVYNEMKPYSNTLPPAAKSQYNMITEEDLTRPITTDYIRTKLMDVLGMVIEAPPEPTQGGNRPWFMEPRPRMPRPSPSIPPVPQPPARGGRTSKIGKKFGKCVKSVRSTVKARKGSTKESAAIAICTTTILHPHKRTLKSYRKGRLVTQKKKRGGMSLNPFSTSTSEPTLQGTNPAITMEAQKVIENIDSQVKAIGDVDGNYMITVDVSSPQTKMAIDDIIAKLHSKYTTKSGISKAFGALVGNQTTDRLVAFLTALKDNGTAQLRTGSADTGDVIKKMSSLYA